jgi:hypothetical protein
MNITRGVCVYLSDRDEHICRCICFLDDNKIQILRDFGASMCDLSDAEIALILGGFRRIDWTTLFSLYVTNNLNATFTDTLCF